MWKSYAARDAARYAVMALYAAYAIVICVAWASSKLPLALTVQVCLYVHLGGVLLGLAADRGDYVYPDELNDVRLFIIAWDVVQLGFAIALTVSQRTWLAERAAAIALVGIVGCFYKVFILTRSSHTDACGDSTLSNGLHLSLPTLTPSRLCATAVSA